MTVKWPEVSKSQTIRSRTLSGIASLSLLVACIHNREANDIEAMAHIASATYVMGTDDTALARLMLRYPDMPRDVFEPELPSHTVKLKSYYIDRYEVTNREYRAFLLANPVWQRDAAPTPRSNGAYLKDWLGTSYPGGHDSWPVTYITWYSANAYCKWRSKRLPSETEWEYAARGGLSNPEFPWGDSAPTGVSANWSGAAIGHPTDVGRFAPNGYGLYDMAGNVWEYTADLWPQEAKAKTPVRYAIRGGSYGAAAVNLRVRYRDSHPALGAAPHVGFRCAR